MTTEPQLDNFFSYIDNSTSDIVKMLAEAVAIPSVSGEKERRPDVFKMVDWMAGKMKEVRL